MNPDKKDSVRPDGAWKFDGEVAEVFDDMLNRSIPQYEVMRDACFGIGRRFVEPGSDVVDLGASRGEALGPFIEHYGAACDYVAVECSRPMLEVLRGRFGGDPNVVIQDLDLRREYPRCRASLTLSVLTLQFVPIEYRQRILKNVWERTLPGGAFLIVEKVLGETALINESMVDLYLSLKERNGYTGEQIARKKLSLEGVLVPVTAAFNEELLRGAGFREIDCFWRWMNFAAWLAVKD